MCGEITSKTPGRIPNLKESVSRKDQLSSDAKIIIALLKRQPLTKKEICIETKLSQQTFYRNVSLLKRKQIIQDLDQKYALWNFEPLETKIEAVFSKLMEETNYAIGADQIVNKMGMPWHEIEHLTLKIAKKLGSTIKIKDGQYIFYKPNSSNTL